MEHQWASIYMESAAISTSPLRQINQASALYDNQHSQYPEPKAERRRRIILQLKRGQRRKKKKDQRQQREFRERENVNM